MAGWQVHLLYVAIGAIVLAIVLFVAFRKKQQYDNEAMGSIKAEIWLPTGRPLEYVVNPTPDGWVKLGKLGDYKLAVEGRICTCGHDEHDHEVKAIDKDKLDFREIEKGKCKHVECTCTKFEVARVISAIRRWDKYPANPFMGLKALQTEIRTEAWYLNNPEPITPSDHRTAVTAVDAAMHTREMDAQNVAIKIQELESHQRSIIDALAKIPNATIIYIGLGAAVLIPIINFVRSLGGG